MCFSLLGGARERKLKDVFRVLHGFEIVRKLEQTNVHGFFLFWTTQISKKRGMYAAVCVVLKSTEKREKLIFCVFPLPGGSLVMKLKDASSVLRVFSDRREAP